MASTSVSRSSRPNVRGRFSLLSDPSTESQAAELQIVKVLIRELLDRDRDRLLNWLQARYDLRGRERPYSSKTPFEREVSRRKRISLIERRALSFTRAFNPEREQAQNQPT